MINKTVTTDGARVRTGPSTIYSEVSSYYGGLDYGVVVSCYGFIRAQDPYGDGRRIWVVTTNNGRYIWSPSVSWGDLSGLVDMGYAS